MRRYDGAGEKKRYDPLIGNKGLIDSLTTKLLKRGKKNPIIIGDPGTGKTKVMEGLAQAIVKGDVPEKFIGSRLLSLDLHQINDTPFLGSFESRILPILKGISERNASGKHPPILLGLDEFAEAQNAGGHAHSPGFKGQIKPFLTSGEIFMISATTEEEYRTKVEKDAALARRLQPVFMKEPSVDETAEILSGLKRKFSSHFSLNIPTVLMKECAALADRYVHTVNKPDSAIDLLDEACALAQKQGDKTLHKNHLLQAASDKTNIALSFLSENDNKRYATLEKKIAERVLGQDEAIRMVAAALKRAKAGFKDGNGPTGNFLFIGPTGVGKTELSKALADFLFGTEDMLVRYDMSEFMEQHNASRFVGSPPGYVSHEEGGLLIKDLRAKPFAVYLYDEFEKAHPDIFNILLAPFSDGIVTDGRGVKGNMRHAINIMTSNLGADAVLAEGRRRKLDPVRDFEEWQKMAEPIYTQAVESFFRPEFRNRLDGIVYFNSLRPEIIDQLIMRCKTRTEEQLRQGYGLALDLSGTFEAAVRQRGFDPLMGARPLKRTWQDIVETPLSNWLLERNTKRIKKGSIVTIFADEPPAPADEDDDLETIIARAQPKDIVPKFRLRPPGL